MEGRGNKMYKVIDLFCGAGGLSLGFKMAGFDVIGGLDFDQQAIQTHEKNFPNSINICGDIKELSNTEIKEIFGNDVDVIVGGPPCQGFSTANMWQKDSEDERNKLFYEYIRFIEVYKPKAFLIENVRGILSKNDGFAKEAIYKIAEELGYNIDSDILLASDFGVPQKRVRAFFVGVRKDINQEFHFSNLLKKTKVTVEDAISDLYGLETNGILSVEPKTTYQALMRAKSNNLIYNHDVKYPMEKVQERIKHVHQGGNWKDVPEHLWDNIRTNRHSSAYRRLDEKDVSITIDTGHMNYFHPIYNRVPTVRESARLQSFPDDFIFVGNSGAQFRQVGNAVPPLLAKSIADELMIILNKK